MVFLQNGYLAELRAVLARKSMLHLVEHASLYTLHDLLLCHRKRLVPMLQDVFKVYIRHVLQCQECLRHAQRCVVCGGACFEFDLRNVLSCGANRSLPI